MKKSTSTTAATDAELKAHRLAEVSGAAGVKDRLGQWNQVTSHEGPTSDKKVIEERLAEVKGAAGVKDRAGAFAAKADDSSSNPASKPALEEVKGAPGVKDRLGKWDAVIAGTDAHPASTGPKVADLPVQTGVKQRKEGWQKQETQDTTIASTADPNLAEARTAELKKGSSVRDRMGAYAKATEDKQVERAPVVIPTDVSELPTKETQGQ